MEAVSSDIEHNANIVFHFAQFVFYLGWVTVAKIMLNPFGEDPGEFMLLEDLLLFLNFFRLPQPLNINPYGWLREYLENLYRVTHLNSKNLPLA